MNTLYVVAIICVVLILSVQVSQKKKDMFTLRSTEYPNKPYLSPINYKSSCLKRCQDSPSKTSKFQGENINVLTNSMCHLLCSDNID